MTIAEQLKQIKKDLDDWAKQNGGKALIVGDFVQLVSGIMAQKPGAPVAYIAFNSEEPRNEITELGRVDRSLLIVISRGRSLKLDHGDDLVEDGGNSKPMFDLVEEAREVLRNMEFDEETTEVSFDYKGSKPFQVEGMLLDAYQIEMSIGTQIPSDFVPAEAEG